MFDTLSDKLQATLGDLRGRGRLSEEDISKAAREIRLALLEADVNLQVVKQFVASVKERALGADVAKSLNPGQQIVKIVHEELTALMGSGGSKLAFAGRPPTVILLAGLQGSGKTTAAAKLALLLRKQGKAPALVAADLQRPAAIDQLEQLGKQIQIPVYAERGSTDAVAVATKGVEQAKAQGRDVVILDTAGRLHIDDDLMDELARVRKATNPMNVLLVLDAMTGQDAVAVAEVFAERVAFDGVVLTKLDGDARGGAALSVRAVTGKPIKLVSTGEKLDQIEEFHPDRMASRILGMGDVLTLIEKAEAAADEDDQAEMEKRMRAGQFTFDDFLRAQRMMRKMGPMSSVLGMIPGLGKEMRNVNVDERELGRVEAIILSMTPGERGRPEIINGQRRARIARGSGTTIQEVNRLMSRANADAEAHEADGTGQDAELEVDRRAAAALAKETNGYTDQAGPGGLEEESDLPGRRGRRPFAARRPVHRDRRALQPADGPLHDRSRPGEDRRLDRQGRAAERLGEAPHQGRRGLMPAGVEELLVHLAQGLVDKKDDVRVERIERDDTVVFELHVAEEDLGKVIGRGRADRAVAAHPRPRQRGEGRRTPDARDRWVRTGSRSAGSAGRTGCAGTSSSSAQARRRNGSPSAPGSTPRASRPRWSSRSAPAAAS